MKKGIKKIAKYIDLHGSIIINLKNWKLQHPQEVYFDSKFEYDCYVIAHRYFGSALDFSPESIDLFDGFNTITSIKHGEFKRAAVRKCSYTPDFIITCPNQFRVFIDSKGYFFPESKLRYKIFQNLKIKDQKNAISIIIKSLEEMHSLCRLIKQQYFSTPIVNITNYEKI